MAVSVADIKTYAGLPAAVPAALVQSHLDAALLRLQEDAAADAAPEGKTQWWDIAHTNATLVTLFPHLNTIALDGYSQLNRVEGSVDARFFDPEDVDQRVDGYEREYQRALAVIRKPATADDTTTGVSAGGIAMIAV